MKKFNRVCLILAAVFTVAGIGFVTAGIATGATWETFRQAVYRGDFSIGPVRHVTDRIDRWSDDWDESFEHLEADVEDKFDAAEEKLDHLMDGAHYSGSGGTVMSSDISSIRELELDFKYGDITIGVSDDKNFRMEVENVDESYVKWEQDGDTLEVKGESRKLKDGEIFLYLPVGMEFHEVSIHVDAGAVFVDELTADQLDVKIGAGVFDGEGLITAKEADLEVGAGQITMEELESSKIDLNCGVGQIDITVAGAQEEYNYEIKCGLGQISIGDTQYTALNKKKEIHQSGNHKEIEAECGMGQIDVQFVE